MIYHDIVKKDFQKLKDFEYKYFYVNPITFESFYLIKTIGEGYKIHSQWSTDEQVMYLRMPYLLPDECGIFED